MFTIRFIATHKWFFIGAFALFIAALPLIDRPNAGQKSSAKIYLKDDGKPVEVKSKRQTDSLNFVAARAQFNAVGDEFNRLNKISSGLADGLRDSVNACYRRADSLKTVFEASR